MLLRIDQKDKNVDRVIGAKLAEFGLDERGFQDILFRTLDRLVGDDELLMLAQSRHWQEEPDLLALDRDGKLYIFEVKVWEARQENLLQVLRYGQLNGKLDYDGLQQIWRRTRGDDQTLSEAHRAKFDVELSPDCFNRKQVFVVLTNGLDVDTRQAIRYWKTTGLDIRPWVYRAYRIEEKMLLEIAPFRTVDDPLEDQAEGAGSSYYLVNTNIRNDEDDDADMLSGKKVAAYFDPWKYKIARIRRNDIVFLYRSGVGIVAIGKADGKLIKSAYHGDPKHPDEEFSMKLVSFTPVDPPMTAAEIKEISGNEGIVFRQTMISLDQEGGAKIFAALTDKKKEADAFNLQHEHATKSPSS